MRLLQALLIGSEIGLRHGPRLGAQVGAVAGTVVPLLGNLIGAFLGLILGGPIGALIGPLGVALGGPGGWGFAASLPFLSIIAWVYLRFGELSEYLYLFLTIGAITSAFAGCLLGIHLGTAIPNNREHYDLQERLAQTGLPAAPWWLRLLLACGIMALYIELASAVLRLL